MSRIIILFILSLSSVIQLKSQTIYGAIAPDSIKKKCDAVIVSEIGNDNFGKYVKLIKSDAHTKNNVLNAYTLFYSFNFPNVKESHVVFTLEYKLDDKGKGSIVKDVAFKNHTRLPLSIKKNGVKVISYADAKKAAVTCDTTLKKYSDKLYGEISTEYDSAKKDYFFVWYFYYLGPCKNCEAEMYTTHSAYIDAVSGKQVKNTPVK